MKDLKELFQKAGGSIQLAASLGLNQWTVERWLKVGIPIKYWDTVMKYTSLDASQIYELNKRAINNYKKSLK